MAYGEKVRSVGSGTVQPQRCRCDNKHCHSARAGRRFCEQPRGWGVGRDWENEKGRVRYTRPEF